MSGITYKEIVNVAYKIKKGVENKYELVKSPKWSYYIAKAILNPEKEIGIFKFYNADEPTGNNLSRQVKRSVYLDMAERFTEYVEKNHHLPNYIKCTTKLMRVSDYTYMFSCILVEYDKTRILPKTVNVNSKAFVKPTETVNKVYTKFVKTFGKITCIDDALEKIAGKGYGYYYDDQKSNFETIEAIESDSDEDDPNCTDATQMMKNVADGTKKYKRVDCVHVKCKGGDGHVYLKVTQKDGSVFYRDPAAVLDSGIVTKVWCSDGNVLAINPSWWLSNLNREGGLIE